jgi:protein tyrosine/serine phosphatase
MKPTLARRRLKLITTNFVGSMQNTLRTAKLSLLALVATVMWEGRPAAQSANSADTTGAITIYNFAKVADGYYRGGQPLGDDYARLAALGVKTVVNLTNDTDGEAEEQRMVEQHGMKYVSIPMTTRKPPTDAQIAAFFAAVEEEGGVYVHCVGGRHRTGVMTAIYRMTKDGLSGEQAFQEMKQYKYGPDFLHPEFKKFVHAYKPKPAATAVATGSAQQ